MSFAEPSGSLADPGLSSPLLAAVQWLQGTLLGTAATSVAVICVAAVGLMMLSGRLGVRRALTVVLGCFVLFGASTIAAGIQSVASIGAGSAEPAWTAAPPAPAPVVVAPPPPPPPAPSPNSDPFAGAAVPSG